MGVVPCGKNRTAYLVTLVGQLSVQHKSRQTAAFQGKAQVVQAQPKEQRPYLKFCLSSRVPVLLVELVLLVFFWLSTWGDVLRKKGKGQKQQGSVNRVLQH
jgi:hypothetical protein